MRDFWLIIALFLLTLPGKTLACYGGRPLGMGGAYVGLAEGAEAIYWNPGGLVFSRGGSFSSTQTIPPEGINYQSFIGVAYSTERLGLGFGYTGLADFVGDRYWLQGVLSLKIAPYFGIGLGKRSVITWRGGNYYETDLGLAFRWKDLRFGLLAQSFDTLANFRPGIAWVGDRVTLEADIYDLTDNYDARSINLGMEYKFPKSLSLRWGLYRIGSKGGPIQTVGVGKSLGLFSLDGVIMGGSGISALQITAGYLFQ